MQVQALSVGGAVDADSPDVGTVHSVFATSANLEMGGEMWTLLAADRGDLPFGIRVACTNLGSLHLCRGDRVDARAGFVAIGSAHARLVVDCRAARRWLPAWPRAQAPGLGERLDAIAAAAADRAWHRSSIMAQALVSALNDREELGEALVQVVGCGPGATPAGDDVLVGILAVLASPSAGPKAVEALGSLRSALLPLLAATPEVSAHLLRQAARGMLSRPVHELVCAAIGAPAGETLRQAVQRVVETGATSGADTCMGLVAAARACLLECDERAAA